MCRRVKDGALRHTDGAEKYWIQTKVHLRSHTFKIIAEEIGYQLESAGTDRILSLVIWAISVNLYLLLFCSPLDTFEIKYYFFWMSNTKMILPGSISLSTLSKALSTIHII